MSNPSDKPNLTAAFSLPNGTEISGVVSWSIEMCRRLNRADQPAVLFEHASTSHPTTRPPDCPQARFINCPPIEHFSINKQNIEIYKEQLPAVFVPNYNAGTFATLASLSKTHGRQMRVIGYCHSFENYYFTSLKYYEPLIHRFVAVSEECAEELRTLMPERAEDILVRPYGVHVCELKDRVTTKPEDPIRLLYAGRIVEEQKRVSELPKLAEELVKQGVNFHLRIVGDGKKKAELRNRIRQLDEKVRSRISLENSFPPHEMSENYLSTDVCVLVSEYEGTSIFMLEGMAHGCVPVVTRVSGTAAVIRPGENGFCEPVGDLSAQAAAIKRLDDDRELLKTMSAGAHDSAQAYSFEKYIDWYQDLLPQVWQEPPRRWPTTRKMLRLRPSWVYKVASFVPGARKTYRLLNEYIQYRREKAEAARNEKSNT